MPTVIPVKFRYAARDLWFDPQDTGAVEADHVICSTERGTEIGIATADPHEVSDEEQREICGDAALKPVLRIATDEDLDRADHLAELGDEAMPTFRRMVSQSGLDMKPVGVEYLFGGEKAVCYFSAEDRVDFRQLVRDMARELHERIDMRQIGVREEAAIVGGYAHCGQELCCTRFGHQFEPVSIRMAKEQDLPLNSTKISGACGRLMCCLRYEFEAYRDFKGRAPKRNAVIETPLGKGKIVEYDTPKEQLTLRLENGKQVRVALADMEASEAAVKKSEELNCPCRPDTASRAALERLATPEIQLALADLDREMGLMAEEQVDTADLFVEAPRTRRRRHAETPAQPQQQEAAPTPEPEQETSTTRSRRRRKKRTEAEAPAVPQQTAQRPAPTAAPQAEAKTPRRRRHHAVEGAVQQQSEQPRPAAREEAKQDAKPRRQRRRPGDHGGEKAQTQQAGRQQAPRQQASKQQQAPKQPAPRQQVPKQPRRDNATQQEGADVAAKRRRRHRGGRGKGKGGAEGTATQAQQ